MTRATIRDLALAAGVSVSTVNRVLAGADNVRGPTTDLVKATAERIGFYGLGVIRSNITAQRPKLQLGFLLHQPSRLFYQLLGKAIMAVAVNFDGHDIETEVVFVEDLSPQNISEKLLELGERCNAVAVVAAVHPTVSQAVEALEAKAVPVVAMISQLSATGSVAYVGPDNWKAGRTAAWAIANMNKQPGKVGILVGNHRYRCQEMNESGFRSYFREFAPEFTLLEPLSTFETNAVAEEMTERLLKDNPDIKGLFLAGGGVSGFMTALRSRALGQNVTTVCHQLMDNTKAGLLDGTLSIVLNDPRERMARETISVMINACQSPSDSRKQTIILPFEIYTRENI